MGLLRPTDKEEDKNMKTTKMTKMSRCGVVIYVQEHMVDGYLIMGWSLLPSPDYMV